MVRSKLNPYGLLLTALFFSGCARAQIIPTVPLPEGTIPALKKIPLGEELEYKVAWWGVPVGLVSLKSSPSLEREPSSGKKTLKLTVEGRSNVYLEMFYPVLVRITSWIDPEGPAPLASQAFVKRRWRRHESQITFDRAKGEALHQLPKGRSATVPVTPATQDGLSVLYYVRTLELHVGQTLPLEITADGKNWHLNGKILRLSTIKLSHEGSWMAVEGQAELAYPVPFFQGSRARVWFSADAERIPLYARIHSRIGPVTVVLIKRTQTGHSNVPS